MSDVERAEFELQHFKKMATLELLHKGLELLHCLISNLSMLQHRAKLITRFASAAMKNVFRNM
jgi:hypothetical protein